MAIRILQTSDPGTPVQDRSIVWADFNDVHLKMRDDLGNLVYLSGITGLVAVEKVVKDAALESPGNGLPSETPGEKYLILTNGQDGARDSGWGAISGALGTMLIERSKANFEWLVQHVLADGDGKFLVYSKEDDSIWIQAGGSWRQYANAALSVPSTLAAGGTLSTGSLNRVTGLSGLILPSAALHKGELVEIKYMDNNGVGPLITSLIGDQIEFNASFQMSGAYQYLSFRSDGTQWLRVG